MNDRNCFEGMNLPNGVTKIEAYAKINTYLEVLERRADGYHELCSHMQLISLCDTLTVSMQSEMSDAFSLTLSLSCDRSEIPTGEDNLILRAARAYFSAIDPAYGKIRIDFALQKNIPMQGGLAGGSADAAAALIAINRLCGEPLTESALCDLGVRLGADIPFCIRGRSGAQTARGIGEQMTPAPGLPSSLTLLVVLPGTAVSTPAAFCLLDERYGQADVEMRRCENEERYAVHLSALERGCMAALAKSSFNRFEEAVFALQPTTREVFDLVGKLDADFVRMSGSGPTIVGGFVDAAKAIQAKEALAQKGYISYLCHGCSFA